MADKIRLGFVGANVRSTWSSQSHFPALLASPDVELTAVCTWAGSAGAGSWLRGTLSYSVATLLLAPPLLARKKPGSKVPAKMTFGGWMMPAFGVLAKFKSLRGTALDVFGYTHERRRERALRERYLALAGELANSLRLDNKEAALKLANLPDQVRGYGHIKLAALDKFDAEWPVAMAAYQSPKVIQLKRQA